MTKHHWRQQIKSFFEYHADSDKYERLKQSRNDMEEKKDEIIKLIKEDGGNVAKTESLVELISEYHHQYESLYEDHLHLTGELNKKAQHDKKDKHQDVGKNSSNSSSSDSDEDEVTNGLQTRITELEADNAEYRTKVVDLELNLRSLERKADELSRGVSQSQERLIIELQTTIEDLKRDMEMDKDELTTIEEKNRNLEVMLRLSNQKKRVAEQILTEKEVENAILSQKVQEYIGMIKGIFEKLMGWLGEVESVISQKFEEDYRALVKSIAELSMEVESVRTWVAMTKLENAKRKKEIENVFMEKDARIMIIEDEKKEAIRQLCVWTEYHRSRCQELHRTLLKIDPQT